MGFVHLHVHSQFSLLDGTMGPAAVAAKAAALGMPAVALTDTCNLYGAVTFYKACKGAGIRPVLGAELVVQHEGLQHEDPRREDGGYQLIALVEGAEGYRNLCRLVTAAIFDGMHYKPRVSPELLDAHHQGLVFLTGGRKGLLGRPVLDGNPADAEARLDRLLAFLDAEHLYLALEDHGLDGQEAINDAARTLAAARGLHTVVTNAVHYEKPEDAAVHEVLNAIAMGASLKDPGRVIAPTDQAWFKTEDEIRALFPDDPEAIERTVAIAERCHFAYDFDTYHFPATTPPDAEEGADTDPNWAYFYRAFPPPRDYGLPDPSEAIPPRPPGAGNMKGYFAWYCDRGLDLRLKRIPEELHPTYRERLRTEIDIINAMGFPAYMLIVAEFINWSKDNEIPVGPGRGSAAGSLVAWAMRITDIDPIRFDLLFERFLNPERVSMPDIDVDFCQDRREEAIEHVRQKYGADYVSQIITYGTLKAKAAVRDVARVLDLTFNEADRVAKLVPDKLGTKLQDAFEVEQFRALYDGDPKVRRVVNLAMAVEGMTRQTGVHAAGVVIADKPLVEYAPLYRDEPGGGPVVQYDMKSAEGIGLIKFDFLGLKTLDQIRDAVKFVQKNHGVTIDMVDIPVDDEAAYRLLQDGDTLGIFQLESSGMRELLQRLKPTVLDDLVALVALYRPGPLEAGMTADFVERKHGRQKVEYPLPQLEPILRSTYGTIVYQEQVMQIAQVMASYSLGEADLLRRAMGKKKKEEMDKQKVRFMEGSLANGIDRQKADDIFELLAKFAAYGFNKSHSAAYGYVSYQTAWLKAHYRPEYMAALMTIESGNTDKLLVYIADCRKAGIRVDPVCVNRSERHFDVPRPQDRDGQDSIRFGLSAVKNVGGGAVDAVLEARRKAGGSFRDAFDVFDKVDVKRVNRKVFENLVKAGAFDFSGVTRAALMEGLEAAMALAARRQADRAAGQGMLFGGMGAAVQPVHFRFPDVPEWSLSEKLQHERETLGLYLTGHPMQGFARDVGRFATAPIASIGEHPEEQEVRLAGLPSEVKVVKTRRGDRMAFVTLEDVDATIECIFFSDPWARSQRVLKTGLPLLVTGRLERSGDEVKVLASSAEFLNDVRARATKEVRFELTDTDLAGDRLDRFLALLDRQRGPCRARLVLRVGGAFQAEIELPDPVDPGVELEEGAASLFGRPDVVALH